MAYVTFITGLLIAGTAAVAGAALVIVWTMAYGAGRYCRQQIHRENPRNSKVRILQAYKQRVS